MFNVEMGILRRLGSRNTNPHIYEGFAWLVTPQLLNLTFSNIFFLGLLYDLSDLNELNDTTRGYVGWPSLNHFAINPYKNFDAQYLCISHYFNISMPAASPISNVSDVTRSTTSTNINTQPSEVLPISLGLELGLGLPLIALSAFMLIIAYRRKRSTTTCAEDPPDLNMTTAPLSPGSHQSTLQGKRSNPS